MKSFKLLTLVVLLSMTGQYACGMFGIFARTAFDASTSVACDGLLKALSPEISRRILIFLVVITLGADLCERTRAGEYIPGSCYWNWSERPAIVENTGALRLNNGDVWHGRTAADLREAETSLQHYEEFGRSTGIKHRGFVLQYIHQGAFIKKKAGVYKPRLSLLSLIILLPRLAALLNKHQ